MRRSLAVLASFWIACSLGQDILSSSFGGGIGDNTFTVNCGSSFQDANSTGLSTVQPNVVQIPQDGQPDNDSGYTLPVSIGVTILEGSRNNTSGIQESIWYSTAGANYSDNIGLGYDVCAFLVGQISVNTLWRAQSDTGNCKATYDEECVSALESAASSYAMGLIQNATPPPKSNLTADSLSRVCYDIGQSIEQDFPEQCQKYMNQTTDLVVSGFPITDIKKSPLYNGCTLSNDDNAKTYDLLYTQNTQLPADLQNRSLIYSAYNWNVVSSMITFMPVANYNAEQSIGNAVTKMRCLRATNVNPGSEKVLTPPTPTPLGSSGLSGGAIAGVVVGVVVAVAIIAGAVFWFWRRRRVASKRAPGDGGDALPPGHTETEKQRTVAEAPTEAGIKELSPDSEVRPELSAYRNGSVAELGADYKPQMIRRNAEDPHELLAEVPEEDKRR